MAIMQVRSASAKEWDSIWQACDYATYFHSREWSEIWSAASGGKCQPDARWVTFADGKQALLPLTRQKRYGGFLNTHLSSPGRTFGGWLAVDLLDAGQAAALARYLTAELGGIQWRINPYDPMSAHLDVPVTKDDQTQTLALAGDFDVIFRRWTKGHRSAAKKAQREGVTARLASTLDDWRSYYAVYEDSIRRWGENARSRHQWALFEALYQCQSPHVRLWLADYQGQTVAGALCFYAACHVVYWHGAALESHFHLNPSNLLLHDAMKHACESGYRWFDFNPSGGLDGVKAFKKSFGAETKPCPVVVTHSRWQQIAGALFSQFR